MGLQCPHCKVSMWPYETVKKADGTYKRYECRIQYCQTCKGKCTHKEMGHRPEKPQSFTGRAGIVAGAGISDSWTDCGRWV